jgi:hypothetical protein
MITNRRIVGKMEEKRTSDLSPLGSNAGLFSGEVKATFPKRRASSIKA